MRVFITGSSGFIGSHLVEALHAKGYTLRCLVRRTSNLSWIKHLPIEYVYGDLFDQELLQQAVRDIDIVYHLAGITKARTAEEYFQGNQVATRNLLNAVIDSRSAIKKFVHVSSQTVVGPSLHGAPVDESVPFHPITTYGRSKMEAELECLRVQEKIPITIVRAPAVYGPRDKDVFEFFKAMSRGLQPMIGFNNKSVSLVHAKDLVDGMILAGENEKSAGQTYFVASERYYNWKEVGEVTARIMEKKFVLRLRIPEFLVYAIAGVSQFVGAIQRKPVVLNIEKARDIVQDAWTCSIAKAKRDLGYTESFTLEEGIRNTVHWYRQQGWIK